MALQLAVSTRNAGLDAYETDIGTAPTLKLRTGAAPADCATADSGTALTADVLPSDWMAAASGGVKAKLGTWQTTGIAAGTAGHYRIYDSGGNCKVQGTVTAIGGGGDMTLDNVVIAVSQAVAIATYSWTAGNP